MKELYDSHNMQRLGLRTTQEDGDCILHESCGHPHTDLNFDFEEKLEWVEELTGGDHECSWCGEYIDAIGAPQPDTFDPFL